MNDFITNLQKKPYETKVRILWGVSLTIGIILIVVWLGSLKNMISNTSGQAVVTTNPLPISTKSQILFIKVERVEKTTTALKIYFNINNPTDDILNIPSGDNVTLNSAGANTHPQTLLDRQSQPFAKKILSHTQMFGILVFPATPDTQGTLTFDQMFMEQTPDQKLSQELFLDFARLNQNPQVRN